MLLLFSVSELNSGDRSDVTPSDPGPSSSHNEKSTYSTAREGRLSKQIKIS